MKRPAARMSTIPAPIEGWNARDPLSAMKNKHAVILRNFIPSTGGVDLRRGNVQFATGLAAIKTLMEYNSPTGLQKLFAATDVGIYDLGAGGTLDPAVKAVTVTDGRFQHVMFGTPGGSYLVAVNGEDAVQNYNGTTWSHPTITGAVSVDLVSVNVHASRLWFIEKETLKVWYLPASLIAGAATAIDFADQFRLGGYLVAMASWTRDGGDGSDDVAVFISSTGEVLTYTGTDPNSADTWQKNGLFRIPEPVGRRCVLKAGGDLGIITSQGVVSLSNVLGLARSQQGKAAATDTIKGAFSTAYAASGQLFGWQMIEYPRGGLMIVNVPQSDNLTSLQYVMNALTGAWCEFDNLNAVCWGLKGQSIYFGTQNGSVFEFDVGYLDDETPIQGTILPAFSNFGRPFSKQFLMARPLYTAALGIIPPLTLKTDYDITPIALPQPQPPENGSIWDEAPWDTSSWGPPIVSVADWQGLEGIGQVGSVYIDASSETQLTLQHIDILIQDGGVL